MTFDAKYAGSCAAENCWYGDNRISEGDAVEYVDDELLHEACASRARRGEPAVCPDCNLQHRGECE